MAFHRGDLSSPLFLALFFMFLTVFPRLLRAQTCSISVDATASTNANAATVTLPITIAGSNRLLVVHVKVDANDGASVVNQVTYNGVFMNQVMQTVRSGGGGARQATYVLTAPATGTHNVVVVLQGSKSSAVGAMDYNGVDQSTPLGATTFVQDAASISHSVHLTTTTNLAWVVSNFIWYSSSTSLSLGAGQTQRWIQSGSDRGEGDDKTSLLAGPCTMTYTLSSSKQADIQVIELRPACVVTLTATPSFTPTTSPTSSPTATASRTWTSTPTRTASASPTTTPTRTTTRTFTVTPSPTTAPPTATPTWTSTPAPVDTRVPDGIFGATHNSFLGGDQTVTFFYEVPTPARVHLSIMNVLGRRVRELVDEDRPTGVSNVDWDGRNDQGTVVAEDVYFILLKVGEQVVIRKVGVRHEPR